MKIAIMGAGAVGGYYGGVLARFGEDVTLICRGAHLDAIARDGLKLSTHSGEFTVRPGATADPSARKNRGHGCPGAIPEPARVDSPGVSKKHHP